LQLIEKIRNFINAVLLKREDGSGFFAR